MANDINISWGAQNLNIAMQTQEINVAFDGNIFNEPVTFSNWYIYIAYASDTNGTGFSTTPSGALKYIGVLNTTTLVNDLDASYYVGKWFKYIGDDGAGAEWVSWGTIVGSILDQLDLQTALNWKANTSHTHTIENVTGLQTALDGKQASLGFTPENSANKWQANGFAPLDATAKVPLANMPASLIGSINYQGSWDANTNTPTLSDGTGSKWLYYIVGTWWSQNLGSWVITFDAGDWVVHNGSIWQRFNDGDVSSVNWQNGVVLLDTSHINDTADKRYVTDAEKTKLSNTSNTNTGDQDAINVPYDPGANIDITATDVQGALDQVDSAIQWLYSGRQATLLWKAEGTDIAPAWEAEVIDFASGITASYDIPTKTITFNVAGNKWLAEVDFWVINDNNDIATVTIATDLITPTSYPVVSMYAIATTDHDADDYFVEWLVPYISNIIDGVSFDIVVRAPNLTWWKYKVAYSF